MDIDTTDNPASEIAETKPMKLHFTSEQMKQAIERDPDDASYEAGSSHPEAPKLRFFIEHGVIHDRATGKHVRTDDTMHPHEDGIVEACVLLNALSASAAEVERLTAQLAKCREANETLRIYLTAIRDDPAVPPFIQTIAVRALTTGEPVR